MSLFISSLNSGSNGNCYYIGNDREAVLIDAGLSCREIETRMAGLGLEMSKLKAVFISHEHKDHISGLPVLAKKYQLPVYITEGTQKDGHVRIDKHLVNRFSQEETIQIGELSIHSFPKNHDAGDPHSFMICYGKIAVGIFTDIGSVCQPLIEHFSKCSAAFLEANYDEEMLINGGYPYFLKKRITDGRGHLSNKQALELFCSHRSPYMSHLILSHLSKNNNCPHLVKDLFSPHSRNTEIIVASRYAATPLYEITSTMPYREKIKKSMLNKQQQQLSLF